MKLLIKNDDDLARNMIFLKYDSTLVLLDNLDNLMFLRNIAFRVT